MVISLMNQTIPPWSCTYQFEIISAGRSIYDHQLTIAMHFEEKDLIHNTINGDIATSTRSRK